MSRIVYGFSGEGSGHSTRAREMASYLQQQGHDVRLASYDRGYRNLAGDFPILEIGGLTISSSDNRVSVARTISENLQRLPAANRYFGQLRDQLFDSFQPHCVITDFEPMTAYLAHLLGLPLISLDNQHRMRYVELDCPEGLEQEYAVTRAIIRAMVPRPDVVLVTSLVAGKPANNRTFVFPPMVAADVRSLQPRSGEATLVYLTSGFDSLLEILGSFSRERFIVFGSGRTAGVEGRLDFRAPSRTGFLEALADCRAVIATAGFTLISEALYLRKPYLACAMEGQFEQQLNACQLEKSGWGKSGENITRDTVAAFFYDLDDFRRRLVDAPQSSNEEIKEKLGALVANDAAQAWHYRQLRKAE